jgi:hypothetical protein
MRRAERACEGASPEGREGHPTLMLSLTSTRRSRHTNNHSKTIQKKIKKTSGATVTWGSGNLLSI